MMIFINLIGFGLIGFIVWWFWLGKQQKRVKASTAPIDIKVDGGIYLPDTIQASAGQSIQLRFTREDPSPCAQTVVFAKLDISQNLPLKQPTIVTLRIAKAGQYEFSCPMGMYRGTLIVSDERT